MNKQELRQKYKNLREPLENSQIEDLSLSIAYNCLSLPIWDKINYHLFLTIENKKEIDTSFLMSILAGKDKNIILSKAHFQDLSMTHYLLTDNTTLRVNNYGIPEPIDGIRILEDQIEIVFIPLLAYDIKGNRIGYGKGFYDRFLELCSPNTIKVGLSYFEAEPEFNQSTDLDIPLDYCVTPNKIYDFSSNQ